MAGEHSLFHTCVWVTGMAKQPSAPTEIPLFVPSYICWGSIRKQDNYTGPGPSIMLSMADCNWRSEVTRDWLERNRKDNCAQQS